jgi:AcrR family transcriptional regulator
MGATSTPGPAAAAAQARPARRRYHSPLRRQRAAETRERIVSAGATLVRSFTAWDWKELTFRAVAETAGVSESSVYRHFANERELHDAVMHRLGEQAGVTYDGVSLDEVADVAARVFAAMSGFAVSGWTQQMDDPTFTAIDQKRGQALRDAVGAAAPHWSPRERDAAAGVLDVLWSPVSLERLVLQWRMSPEHATEVIRWAIGLVVDSVRNAAPHEGGPRPARGRAL